MKIEKVFKNLSAMNTFIKLTPAAIALLFAATHTQAMEKKGSHPLPISLEQKVQRFEEEIAAKGFEMGRGDVHLFTIEDCKYAIASIGNCLGNNPTAPYIIPTVPLWPNEYADINMQNLLGPVADNMGWTHRLGEREAIVVMAQLPPEGRYFGIQPYIFSREGNLNPSDSVFQNITDDFMKSILFMSSPNPSRTLVFSSIGDSVNNVVIEQQSGAAFDQQRFFIITADAALGRQLSEALLAAGLPDKRQIFTLPVPASFARLGLSSAADDFITLMRYAVPQDKVAGDKWRQELPLAVFRVRNSSSLLPAEPFAMAVREKREARPELKLTQDVDNLLTAVKQKWGQMDAKDSQFKSLLLFVDLIGESCIVRPMNCLGDTADADYQISETVGIDQGELIAVLGTLGTETGNATYTSLSVNLLPELVGTGNLIDEDLFGTAKAFSSQVDNTDKLYLQYYARDCRKIPNCLSINEKMVPRGADLKFIQRNYIQPGSKRGPDPRQVVNPRLIVLKMPKD
jgi:hypothetical protein